MLGKPVIDTGSLPQLCTSIIYTHIYSYIYTYPVIGLLMHASAPSFYVGIEKLVITVVWRTLFGAISPTLMIAFVMCFLANKHMPVLKIQE